MITIFTPISLQFDTTYVWSLNPIPSLCLVPGLFLLTEHVQVHVDVVANSAYRFEIKFYKYTQVITVTSILFAKTQ